MSITRKSIVASGPPDFKRSSNCNLWDRIGIEDDPSDKMRLIHLSIKGWMKSISTEENIVKLLRKIVIICIICVIYCILMTDYEGKPGERSCEWHCQQRGTTASLLEGLNSVFQHMYCTTTLIPSD